MANTIQHKRSSTATTIPTSGQLAAGELAVNTADGKLYLKKDNASIVQIGGPAEAGTLTGATLAAGVTASSLTSLGTLASLTVSGNPALTSNGYKFSIDAIKAKTASYTLGSGDNGRVITMDVATANTLTVPSGLADGFNCTIIQIGAGQTTITTSAGVTLNSYQSALKISGQHGSASIIGYVSNVYNVAGSLSA
jgi:hypothetical protein